MTQVDAVWAQKAMMEVFDNIVANAVESALQQRSRVGLITYKSTDWFADDVRDLMLERGFFDISIEENGIGQKSSGEQYTTFKLLFSW